MLEERENESEVRRDVQVFPGVFPGVSKVSYNWAFIVVSNFGINAQRVFLVFGKR